MAALKVSSVKTLADQPNLNHIPPAYVFRTSSTNDQGPEDGEASEEPIPVVDFSLLTSGTPDQRSRVVQDLGYACQEWGFFMVINHGVDEGLTKRILQGCGEFFDLTEEEKSEYEGRHVLDPIRCGTSFNASVEEIFFWRDYLKVMVHPEFHSPNKPARFSEVLEEYTKAVRGVVRRLLGGISESLGLESCHLDRILDLESSLQILTANLYPPCPQPELAMGMPPHSDHGLLTMLIQNGIGGLQIHHKGRWVKVNAVPGAFLVNTGDHMEILSNGKYGSVLHRAVVNDKTTRMSISVSNGPSPETIVSPVQELLENGSCPAAYIGMKYKDYLELQQSNKLDGNSCLNRVRI
ncbi:protein DMR6-LIKE OXYGENASE 2-like [Punica granatum]|uniref:Protein DMR6-LIKE OXYGENASE 2-like n=1 Tax=Punica granatum TaxID=22663 RepID=A0A218XS17_PUNGR|nr:protein DMR6-LIKE OXYGENASE 2-like [Punica granatum]OWM87734.1 hypothetical protein CDL15_Pgr016430 [Punica granatum]